METQEFDSMGDILEYAITREQESHDFYSSLAHRADRPQMQKVFADFAQEELGHKAKLQNAKERGRLLAPRGDVLDLKLADYLVIGDISGGMDYQQALILAMKKEKASFRLYTDLADRVTSDEVRAMFLTLAQEEAKHKLRFEVEYDEVILTDN